MGDLCAHCLGGDYKTLLEEKAIATIRTYIEIMYMQHGFFSKCIHAS